jgi:hypothetical protein
MLHRVSEAPGEMVTQEMIYPVEWLYGKEKGVFRKFFVTKGILLRHV